MAPKAVLVLRHAEKTGDPEDQSLAAAGKSRAKKLAEFIPDTFGKPDFIFASAITRHSARPYETMVPLSKTIGVPIDATVADNDYGVIAKLLRKKRRYADALVVVCWHHGQIPPMMHYFGAELESYPNPWDRDIFDLILRLKFGGRPAPAIRRFSQPF